MHAARLISKQTPHTVPSHTAADINGCIADNTSLSCLPQMMRTLVKHLLQQLLLLVVLMNVSSTTKHRRRKFRNALVIVADDAGFETSVYGNTVVPTPSLKWLASRGMVFDQAFTVVSSCSSSRASILTGLPPHQNGMYGLHHHLHHFNSFDKVKSLSSILKKRHIKTGIIGKKHVGPESVYPFDFAETEENNPSNQVGRNITNMKNLVARFLDQTQNKQFLLYIGFHDVHRCSRGNFGGFCQNFGNGRPGMGTIEDWTPMYFMPHQVDVPYFVPNTTTARMDIAAQYTAVNRMDQGIGLILAEFRRRRLLENTLVIYTSDNGIPFPSGRTNLYDPGMREPLIVSSPEHRGSWSRRGSNLVSLLDITPTVLDWFQIPYPRYRIFRGNRYVTLTGRSLLNLIDTNSRWNRTGLWDSRTIFSSHSLHEITMYYPMRLARTHRYKLIHNLNFKMPFPVDQDFYVSLTYQELLNNTVHHKPTLWYKNITGYYYRPQFELFDVISDPAESTNLALLPKYNHIMGKLTRRLHQWMNTTDDPWLCAPDRILEYEVTSEKMRSSKCFQLYNDL